MSDAPATNARLPLGRLIILGLVLLIGLGLFFVLGPRTPVMVNPSSSEVQP
jgi:hypothetical protein